LIMVPITERIASRIRRPMVSLRERKRLRRISRNPSSFSVIFVSIHSSHSNSQKKSYSILTPSLLAIQRGKSFLGRREVIEIFNISNCSLSSKCIRIKGEKKGSSKELPFSLPLTCPVRRMRISAYFLALHGTGCTLLDQRFIGLLCLVMAALAVLW